MNDDLSTNNIGIKFLEKINLENFCYVIFYECYPIRSSIYANWMFGISYMDAEEDQSQWNKNINSFFFLINPVTLLLLNY